MKVTLKNIFLFLGLIVVVSCEKIIDVELEDAPQRIVVEGILKNGTGNNVIYLSKTTTVYEAGDNNKITGADVRVVDDAGVEYIFIEDIAEPGKYTSASLNILPSSSYQLKVDINGEIITAVCPTNSIPIIDSLSYEVDQFGFFEGEDTTYLITYHSSDPVDERNYYRVRIWINGEEPDQFYMGTDDFINGQTYAGPFFGAHTGVGDTVFVELLSMDKEVYSYFYQLSNNLDQSQFSATPANPQGNLVGDAIGYFGAFMRDTMTLYLP